MKISDTNQTILIVAGIGVLGFILYKVNGLFGFLKDPNKGTAYEGSGAVGTLGNITNSALGGLPQAIGESISSWFEPDYQPGASVYYVVLFPDNSKHAVPSTDVGPGGYFLYGGRKYRLGVNQAGIKVAAAA